MTGPSLFCDEYFLYLQSLDLLKRSGPSTRIWIRLYDLHENSEMLLMIKIQVLCIKKRFQCATKRILYNKLIAATRNLHEHFCFNVSSSDAHIVTISK